jgi:two-component system response regulator AtoC
MHDATYKLASENLPPPVVRSHVSLLFTWGEAVRALALREGQSIVVGRAEPATFVINDRSLSRTHARLSLRDGGVTLEDLGSTNGSSINGARVQKVLLNEGDVAQLGTIELRIATRVSTSSAADLGVSHADFMRRLTDELQRARQFGGAVSVVALRADEHVSGWAAIRLAVRPVDRICCFAPTLLVVLLLESDAQVVSAWVDRLRRSSKQSWTAGAATYPALACGAEELVSRALAALHAARSATTLLASPAQPEHADAPLILSPAMRRLYELVARAARTTLPVLVVGETGTGKELVAHAVHNRSSRAKAPFKALNCATIPATLIESVLFGHERGAFTGADKQVQGVFEQAHGGTVFLDEVGELSAQAQAALLRVLEQRSIVRVGGAREIEVDVRVVAATHRDLAAMVAVGTFREDLMFRLDALSLRVPPLRERQEEIVPLAELFLARARTQWGASAQRLSEDAVEALVAFGWPGNVRQLKNAIERAVTVCTGTVVELEDLPEQVWAEPGAAPAPTGEAGQRSLPDRVRDFEVGLIRAAMAKAHGNQAQAARILGVPRRTLANKVHAYGLVEPWV